MDFIYRTSARADGNMSLCYGDTRGSLNNRQRFLEKTGVNWRDLVCAKQVHSDAIAYVGRGYIGRGAADYQDSIADTDAFITDKKDIPLAIFSADCLVIFLYDPQAPAIGLAHCGRRSTEESLCAKAIKLMRERFNSRPESLKILLGPAIRSCCYQMDLAAANISQMLEAGARPENISDCKICTSCSNAEYFSFRKEGEACGRMMTVAMLR